MRFLGVLVVAVLPSCSFDGTAPQNARIRCEATSECPNGMACRVGFCIDPSTLDLTSPDLAQPPTVTPVRGRAGAVFTMGLVTTKPLAQEPEVTLRFEQPVVVACTSGSDAVHFSCEYTALGTENEGVGGQVDFDVRLIDLSGNETVRRSAGVLNLDFSPPVLALGTVGPAVARLRATLEIFFTASEPLLGPAVVTASRGLDDGAGGRISTFSLQPEGQTLSYRLTHLVTAQDPAGEVSFTVVMTDLAGNTSTALLVGHTQIDATLPAVLNAAVTPTRAKANTLVEATFEVSKPLAAPPTVTVGGIPMMRDASVTPPSYRYTHTAHAVDGEGPKSVLLNASDLAGNIFSDTLGVVTFDFTPPELAAVSALYTPDPANALASVTKAKAGTAITISVIADEPLGTVSGPGVPPTLTAVNGGSTLTFCLVGVTCPNDTRPSSYTATGATFETIVPVGAPDGVYLPSLTWSDLAGNSVATSFSAPPIVVKTSTPTLTVDQSKVTFLRSPWGNAAVENMGAFVIPAGPYFALAPANTLANVATLPASTFSFTGSTPSRVRVWADAAKSTLLGTAAPNADGSWPRQRLANLDSPSAYVSGLDEAGNESPAVKIANGEWVGTPNPPGFGSSPHRLEATTYVENAVAQDPALTTTVTSGADGAEATAAIARAEAAWRERIPGSTNPSGRWMGKLAYDSARGRVVMFGGLNSTGHLQDVWEWDGTSWVDKTPAGTKPSARAYHAMVYDSARGRVVMFGGYNTGYLQDIWEWDGTSWVNKTPAGPKPSARQNPAMAYDSARGRVVMFGGSSGGGGGGQELWEWDGTSWVDKTPAGTKPNGRDRHAMAYDSARERVVMFGGYNGGYLRDVWEWDGTSWVDKTPTGTMPSARYSHSMAYDSAQARVVLFAGRDEAFQPLQDVWEWDGTSWVDKTPAGTMPSPRWDHALAYDSTRARVVMFGGSSGGFQQDLWEWDGTRWAEKTPSGVKPGRRNAHAMAYDSARAQVVMFGGQSGATLLSEVWEWDGTRWANKTPAGTKPSGRVHPAMAYDSARAQVVMFGGESTAGFQQDIWEWNGTSWLDKTPAGTKPTARSGHAMAYDSSRARVVMFGGSSSAGNQQDLWEWDGTGWVDKTPAGTKPTARSLHAMAYDSARARLVMFGANSVNPADTWEWDGASWVDKTPAGANPSNRNLHAMAYDSARARVVMFGGGGSRQDLWEWDGTSWVEKTPAGTKPNGRDSHAMAYDSAHARVVMFGGANSSGALQDVWEWDASLAQQAAITFASTVSLKNASLNGLRVRAHCGARYSPYGAADVGAALYGWSTGGPALEPGSWRILATNTSAINGSQPYLPAPNAALLDWSAASAADAQSYYRLRDGLFTFQCRPNGTQGSGKQETQVALDFIEVRVRYAEP